MKIRAIAFLKGEPKVYERLGYLGESRGHQALPATSCLPRRRGSFWRSAARPKLASSMSTPSTSTRWWESPYPIWLKGKGLCQRLRYLTTLILPNSSPNPATCRYIPVRPVSGAVGQMTWNSIQIRMGVRRSIRSLLKHPAERKSLVLACPSCFHAVEKI